MKALVFGKDGQVARELARRCPEDVTIRFLDREAADLANPEACARQITQAENVDIVINAAAWTAVDKAESEEETALVVNGIAPGAMAKACAVKEVPFLHISTDYVFDGSGNRPFGPDSSTAPLGAYGRSKLAGEEAIRTSGARYLILRTSWVVSSHGANFVKTMVRLGAERESLRVVADQIGGPTPAGGIADALFIAARAMAGGHAGGIYHFSGAPDVSWADFARAIMEASGSQCSIEDIATSEYPTQAKRPANSRLDCSTFKTDFDVERPDWRAAIINILEELKA